MAETQTREWIEKYGPEAIEKAVGAAAQQWLENYTREALNGDRKIPGLGVPGIARPGLGDDFSRALDMLNHAKLIYDYAHGDHDAVLKAGLGQLTAMNPYTAALWFIFNISASFNMAKALNNLERIEAETNRLQNHNWMITQRAKGSLIAQRSSALAHYLEQARQLKHIELTISTRCTLAKETSMSSLIDLLTCWDLRSEFLTRLSAIKQLISEVSRFESRLNDTFASEIVNHELITFAGALEALSAIELSFKNAVEGYHLIFSKIIFDQVKTVNNKPSGSDEVCGRTLRSLAQQVVLRALLVRQKMPEKVGMDNAYVNLEQSYQMFQQILWQCEELEDEQRYFNRGMAGRAMRSAFLEIESLVNPLLANEGQARGNVTDFAVDGERPEIAPTLDRPTKPNHHGADNEN